MEWFKKQKNTDGLLPWLKTDTGMGRLGFAPDRTQELLTSDAGLDWSGVLTHFASADQLHNPMTQDQIKLFDTLEIAESVQKSLANSAGILGWPSAHADWARPGIMLYGSNPLDNARENDAQLRSAMRVSAPLIACKQFESGAPVGYCGSFICPQPMKIAYAAIGYGDGLPRVLNDAATVWIAGHCCPVVGRVSMDSIAIDVTGLDHIGVGSEVVLWGPEHSIDVLAKAANTISYELMTAIKGPREYR